MNLHDAKSAVRAESLERTGHSGATRARMLETVGRSPRRRLHAAVAAVIASLFGASAFAFYARTPSAPSSKAPPVFEIASSASGDSSTPGDLTPSEHTVVRIEAPPAPVASSVLGTPAAIALPPPPPVPYERKPAIERDAELALYSEAHRLHFVERDMARAVAAWDRYLAATPAGQLAPEARFNRLVGLVKLEKWDDAARALETVDASSRPVDIERLRAVIASHSR